jgi:hypothetical protein
MAALTRTPDGLYQRTESKSYTGSNRDKTVTCSGEVTFQGPEAKSPDDATIATLFRLHMGITVRCGGSRNLKCAELKRDSILRENDMKITHTVTSSMKRIPK